MTEEEAKTKWCPFARTVEHGGAGTSMPRNRVVLISTEPATVLIENLIGINCIGSACMAFRWEPDAQDGDLIVDAADADLLSGAWWDGRYYKNAVDYIHRIVAVREYGEIPDGMFVDHIDGVASNNRRGNLRIVTAAQNAANAASRGGASQYRGVFKARNGKWATQISSQLHGRKHLGTFDSEAEAAKAYDDAATKMHGEFARLNLTRRENSGRHGYCGLAGRP